MSKVLVTGGAGYVGQVLCRELLERGDEVVCFDNLSKSQDESFVGLLGEENFTFVMGNVVNQNDWKKLTYMQPFDTIYHLAAIVGVPACNRDTELAYKVNFEGTVNTLKNRNGARVVFASTGSVYGKVEDICREDSPTNPLSVYGQSKLDAETAVLMEENTVALRFATGFGVSPCMRVNLLVNDLCYQAVQNRCLTIFQADAYRTFIHVKDMASAFIWAAEKAQQRVYNVGSNHSNWTKRELAEYIKGQTGCVVNYEEFSKDPDQRDYKVDYSKILSEGWEAKITIQEGIEKLLKVCRSINVTKPQYV